MGCSGSKSTTAAVAEPKESKPVEKKTENENTASKPTLFYFHAKAPAVATAVIAKMLNPKIQLVDTNSWTEPESSLPVPVLKHNDFIINEHHAIMQMAARVHDREDLVGGKDAQSCGKYQATAFMEASFSQKIHDLAAPVLIKKQKIDGEQMGMVRQSLSKLDGKLAKSAFLAGDKFTVADCSLVFHLAVFAVLDKDGLLVNDNIKKYFSRLAAVKEFCDAVKCLNDLYPGADKKDKMNAANGVLELLGC